MSAVKWTILSLSLFISLALSAQQIPKNVQGKFEYTETKAVDATKEELFNQAMSWMNKYYKQKNQPEDVVYEADMESGIIQANPLLWIDITTMSGSKSGGAISYDFTVEIKEGSFTYLVTNLSHESHRSTYGSGGALENKEPECGFQELPENIWFAIYDDTRLKMEILIVDFKNKMSELGPPEKYR